MANDTWNDQPEPPRSGGCLKGCLIALGILFLIFIVVVIVSVMFWRQMMGSFFYEALAGQIDASTFPAEEKTEAKAELQRLKQAFEKKEIGMEDLASAMTELMTSPVMTMIMANSIEQQYLNGSGLSDEEKQEGRVTLKRFAHGIVEQQIDKPTTERVMNHIGTRGSQGEFQMKKSVSDEELRAFLADAKTAADDAQVPAEPPAVDLSDEIRRAVDVALNKAPPGEAPPGELPEADVEEELDAEAPPEP